MNCPRCGRPVSDGANFCGGCGLPRSEFEKYAREQHRMQTPPVPPRQEIPPVNPQDLDRNARATGRDTGISAPDYSTEPLQDTTARQPSRDSRTNDTTRSVPEAGGSNADLSGYTRGQSSYSYNAPPHPMYTPAGGTYTPPPATFTRPDTSEALSTADYILMMLIMSIPIVGIAYLIYTAFSSKSNANKRSFARAVLIMDLFTFVIALVFILGFALAGGI